MSGIGYGVLPRWLVFEELQSGSLIELVSGWRAPQLPISISFLPVQRGNRRLSAFRKDIHEFLEHIPGVTRVGHDLK